MILKDYLENTYTIGELIMLDDWFNGDENYSTWCEVCVTSIMKGTDFDDLKEICVCVKTLIIKKLKYALSSIHGSEIYFKEQI